MGENAGNAKLVDTQSNKSRRPLSRKNWNSQRNSSAETGEIPVFIGRIGTLASGILLRLDFRNRRTTELALEVESLRNEVEKKTKRGHST